MTFARKPADGFFAYISISLLRVELRERLRASRSSLPNPPSGALGEAWMKRGRDVEHDQDNRKDCGLPACGFAGAGVWRIDAGSDYVGDTGWKVSVCCERGDGGDWCFGLPD